MVRRRAEKEQFNDEQEVVGVEGYEGDIKEFVMPHAVQTMTATQWVNNNTRSRSHGSSSRTTSIFQKENMGYIVGDEAQTSGEVMRRSGAAKYQKGWIDILALSQLLQIFPNGHDNLVVSVAHNLESVTYSQSIKDAVGGKHVVTKQDGSTVTFVVRAVNTWDEPAGGVLRWMSRPSGQYNSYDLQVGDKVLLVDIGGKIGALVPTQIQAGNRVNPYWSQAEEIKMGIHDILHTLEQELHALHRDVFQVSGAIPLRIMQQALRSGGHVLIRNKPYDFTQAVTNALAPFLEQFRLKYESDKIQGGLDFQHVCVTGGGGGLLYLTLQGGILSNLHDYVYLADNPDTIHLANLRGGEYALSQWWVNNADKVPSGKAQMARTGVVLDLGNALLKGKEMGAGYNAA